MADDPIVRLSQLRIIKLSTDVERQLMGVTDSAPVLEILRRLRERAAESLAALVFVNFLDPGEIGKAVSLQNEVKRYDEWVGWLREIISDGNACAKQMTADEREEMLDLLAQTPEGEQEAAALGLVDLDPRDA